MLINNINQTENTFWTKIIQVEQINYMQSNWVDVAIGTFLFLWQYFNSVALIAFNSMYSFFLVCMHNWNSARLKATAVIILYTRKVKYWYGQETKALSSA